MIAAVGLGFLALVAVGVVAVYVVRQNLAHTDLVTHTYQVENQLANFRVMQERLETARRGYLIARDERFYRTFRDTVESLPPMVENLRTLTRDNPRQQARVDRLTQLLAQQQAAGEATIRGARSRILTIETDFADDPGVRAIAEIRRIALAMAEEEQSLLLSRDEARQETIRTLIAVTSFAGVLLLLVGGGSTAIILHYTRDLASSRNALRRMNEGLEDAVKVRTADLQRANDEIQRFAYIVSHDLRSPLVNVMGFTAELEASAKPLEKLLADAEAAAPQIVSPEARDAVRQDLPESIGFIRTSTQKMDRLINAILQLSRQGKRVLTPQALDMNEVFAGIVGTLQHRIDEQGVSVTIDRNLPGLFSDRLAIEQIFANLVENGLNYLKPGRPGEIHISGHRDGQRVLFDVKDNGRGVDPKDHERIFDLFRRSGVQDQPGEGIGLAHVRALAYRLGGTVACDSSLDQGATFRVSLPAQLTGEGSN